MPKFYFPFLATLLWSFGNAPIRWNLGKVVSTTSGPVQGHGATLPNAQNVSEYLGIRFGQDTGGMNRFKKPRPYYGQLSMDASRYVGLAIDLSFALRC
jgi:hypothetical protein